MTKVTADTLRKSGSCNNDLAMFISLYGEEGIEMTPDGIAKVALKFDWLRGSMIVLTPKQQGLFRVLMLAAFRGLNRSADPDMKKRRMAMAGAFCTAYNSPKE